MAKLTFEEREKCRELTRRLQAAGIPVFEVEQAQELGLLISQDISAYESMAFDFNTGTGLIIPLKITCDISYFVFQRFDIALARCQGTWFQPLEENDGGAWPHYDFYGRSNLKFDRSDTINRFIASQRQFRRGEMLKGLLLAFSYDRMPEDILQGEILRGSITICDQFAHNYSANISLRVQTREVEKVLKPNPRRSRLFSRPDFEPLD
jgi:hypothetical protein